MPNTEFYLRSRGAAAYGVAAVLAGAALFAGAAEARDGARYETVSLQGFDLSDPAGVAGAHRRVASTAAQLCADHLHGVSSARASYRRCIADTVDDALADFGDARLLVYHDARKGR